VAQYRSGDFKAALEALEKGANIRNGEESTTSFYRARSHWQMGMKEQARECYDRALRWMEKNKVSDGETERIRAETAALLGIKEPPIPKTKEKAPGKE
jgi:hypothetical protein